MGAFGYGLTGTDDALDALAIYRDDIAKIVASPDKLPTVLARIARREPAECVLALADELWSRGVDLRPHRMLVTGYLRVERAAAARWNQPSRRRAALAAFAKRIATKPPARKPPKLVFRALWEIHGGYTVAAADADKRGLTRRYARIDTSGNVVEMLDVDDVRIASFPCPARRGTLHGYIDAVGAWAIEPQYGEVEPFEHGRALVRSPDMQSCWFIDTRGKRLTDRFERIVRHDGRWHVRKRGKDGVLDDHFRTVIPCRYDYLDYFFDGVARVRNGRRFGLIDTAGRTVGRLTWSEMLVFSSGLAVVKRGARAGFIRHDGTLAIPLRFDDATSFTPDGYAAVCQRGRWGIIDRDGTTVIPFAYRGLRAFYDGRAAAQLDDGRWGYIDLQNKLVIAAKYERAGDFANGVAAVRVGAALRRIDPTGRRVP